eukprot:5589100-Pleurochrysis_carterae.AAC.3
MEDVVLPDGVARRLGEMLAAHSRLRAYAARVGLEEAMPHAQGLRLLFCGPPGSGKTMTANALANRLGKKLLLVNFP